MKAELFISTRDVLGEGPVWDHRTGELLWVDIEGGMLHIYNSYSTQIIDFQFDHRIGAIVPTTKIAVYLVALQNGIHIWKRETNTLRKISDPEEHIPNNRFNDGKCDWDGNLWVGSMDIQATKGQGTLYCIDPFGNVIPKLSNLSISNGIAFDRLKNKMYFFDQASYSVVAYDYDSSKIQLSNSQRVIDIDQSLGAPDGMCIDEEGMLWIAHWRGAQVIRWNPESGEILQKVMVPSKHVTSCCFGGENLDTLYITSAQIGLADNELSKYPESGSVFQYKPKVKGFKTDFYNLIQSKSI